QFDGSVWNHIVYRPRPLTLLESYGFKNDPGEARSLCCKSFTFHTSETPEGLPFFSRRELVGVSPAFLPTSPFSFNRPSPRRTPQTHMPCGRKIKTAVPRCANEWSSVADWVA